MKLLIRCLSIFSDHCGSDLREFFIPAASAARSAIGIYHTRIYHTRLFGDQR